MANIIPLKEESGAQFYPQTHEKAVIDSNGVNLQTKLANITTPSYVTAWDGASTPVVADIPAGVTVTYNTTSYTGTLAASASTLNKTYLVATGTANNYYRYVTQLNGSTYSWQDIGSTAMDLSGYATKAELSQLSQEVDGVNDLVDELYPNLEFPFTLFNNKLNVNWDDTNSKTTATTNSYFFDYRWVHKGDKFRIKATDAGTSGHAVYVCLFDTPPTSANITGEKIKYYLVKRSEPLEDIFEVERDAYMGICYYCSYSTRINGFALTKIVGLTERAKIESLTKSPVSIGLDSEKLINCDDGTEMTISSSYRSSGYIHVEGVEYVCILNATTVSSSFYDVRTSTFGHVFYDNNKQIINPKYNVPLEVLITAPAVKVNTLYPSSVEGYTEYVYIPVPSGAKYLRVTKHKDSENPMLFLLRKGSDTDNTNKNDEKELVAQAKYVADSPSIASLGIIHFTDIHGDQDAANKINEYIYGLSEYTDDILCTGDVAEYFADGTTTYPHGADWWADASGLARKSLFVLGNHDGCTNSATEYEPYQEGGGYIDGKGQGWDYDTYIAPYAENLGITQPVGVDDSSSPNYKACYWHKDYADQKVRLIAVDCIHRFDGVLDPTTGEIVTAGVKQTSNAQELWLLDRLNETLTGSNNAVEGYSVVVCCHYPIDDFSGNNEEWNDAAHKFIYNQKPTGGRIMNSKTEDVTAFHYSQEESYTAIDRFCMRNRVGTVENYTKGSVNNMAAILTTWMNNGGKFVAWLCGHTHVDYMWYSTNYPNILCVVLDQAGNLRGTNTGDRSIGLASRTCANFYSIDTENGQFKIVRLGYTMNRLMNSHQYFCYDYINRKVLNEG